ncbi:hypothetical protein [Kineococcus sp. SYSU DK005]|uniref:hypothetical protein n=1 Tax=Kineococcus sp. SYSU DK005 TaxID=3383126 RepID=UPI003D7D8F4C
MLLAAALVAGCTSGSTAPAPGDEEGGVPVTVRLMWGRGLTDSPSSFLVRVTAADTQELITGSATKAVTVDPAGLVLLDEALPPGSYELSASQVGCGMFGRDCPDDPDSSDFDPAPVWSCSASLQPRAGVPVQVRIVEGDDVDRTDDVDCVVEQQPV